MQIKGYILASIAATSIVAYAIWPETVKNKTQPSTNVVMNSSMPQNGIPAIQTPSTITDLRAARNLRLQHLQSLDAEDLISALKEALQNGDDLTLNIAESLLIELAQRDPTVTDLIRELLSDPQARKKHLVWLLAQIATPEALQAIIVFSQTDNIDAAAQSQAYNSIANIGKHRHEDGSFRTNLGPVLAAELSTLHDDLILQKALTSGLASIGDEASIQAIFAYASNRPANPEQQAIVEQALLNTRNPEAVKPLMDELLADTQLTELGLIAGEALANMGKPQATQGLIDWASNLTDAQQQQQASDWLSKVRDPESIDLILNADEKTPFKAPGFLRDIQRGIIQHDNHQPVQPIESFDKGLGKPK